MSARYSSIRGTFFLDGVPNIFRIFRTVGAKYSRIFCAGVQKIGDAKYPMAWDETSSEGNEAVADKLR